MEVKLTHQECEKYFSNALCSLLYLFPGYGLQVHAEKKSDYVEAKSRLQEKGLNSCIEDIWMEILRSGKKLQVTDEEEGIYTRTITLQDVYDRVPKTPAHCLIEMCEERGDADTDDAILQTVFFENIIFG